MPTILKTVPEELCSLSNLLSVNFRSNHLSGLPGCFSGLTNLATLRLVDNDLTSLPPELGRLQKLTQINLHGNKLTATALEASPFPSSLEVVELGSQRGSGLDRLPQWASTLTNLRGFGASWNTRLLEIPPNFLAGIARSSKKRPGEYSVVNFEGTGINSSPVFETSNSSSPVPLGSLTNAPLTDIYIIAAFASSPVCLGMSGGFQATVTNTRTSALVVCQRTTCSPLTTNAEGAQFDLSPCRNMSARGLTTLHAPGIDTLASGMVSRYETELDDGRCTAHCAVAECNFDRVDCEAAWSTNGNRGIYWL